MNALILLVLWAVGQLLINTQDGDAAQAAGMGVGMGLLVATPCIVFIGSLTTFLTRKSVKYFSYSLLGFAVPSVIVGVIFVLII